MKTLALILGVLFISVNTTLQAQDGVTVNVTIENVLNDNGSVLASLHSGETFLKGAGVIDLTEQAKKGVVTFTFENVKPGTYAVMVLHDENDNQRMDFETNGMPKESYGMTGNSMVMGPPTFADAKFEVSDKDMDFTIRF